MEPWSLIHHYSYKRGPNTCQITRRHKSCTKRVNQTVFNSALWKEEVFLDVPFSIEEVEHTVYKMKLKKSAGPDNLTAEHLKFGGQSIIIWLTEIFNSVVDVEQIPTCLKLGITILPLPSRSARIARAWSVRTNCVIL